MKPEASSSDIDKNLELSIEISTSIKNMVRNYKSRTKFTQKNDN
jgi:hypothetical protein